MIRVHRERHQLLQRHGILGIDLEQGRGHGSEFQALLHDLRRYEEGRRDRFLALDVTAEWPLSQRLALRTSLATSDNRSQPAIYNNRRHAVDIALVARW
jgi:hypothetical protein